MSRATYGTFFLPGCQLTIQEFQKKFEAIVPPAVAWKNDNIGLQIGNGADQIKNILVTLDVTKEVVLEAIKKKANLIVSHHPLLFHPLKNISPSTRVGEIVLTAIANNIAVYAAHTNLDSVKSGVNFTLAEIFGLKDVSILSPIKDSLTKIAVFVPRNFAETVAEAMHHAGAGMFSKYDHCSFRTEGTGTFRGMEHAKPFLGTVGYLEKADETRLEMLCETWKISAVLAAVKKVHPYEEIAYDIYPLANRNSEYGLGAIGDLPKPISDQVLLRLVKKKLNAKALRYSKGKQSIKRVAVCGGSGSELITEALMNGADAMITADIKYHTFQDFENKIMLIDAGHYETERVVLPSLAKQIDGIVNMKKKNSKIVFTENTTNPIRYY